MHLNYKVYTVYNFANIIIKKITKLAVATIDNTTSYTTATFSITTTSATTKSTNTTIYCTKHNTKNVYLKIYTMHTTNNA